MNIIDGLEFKEAHKKSYDVYACKPKIGTRVTNVLEGTNYITTSERPFVISGTVGETWVIDTKKLMDTYCFKDGRDITPEELQDELIDWMHLTTKVVGTKTYYAARLSIESIKDYPVHTHWGDTLLANRPGIPHGHGDYLVCSSVNGKPNTEDLWVVNGEVFEKTYSFNISNSDVDIEAHKETQKPKSILQ